MRDGNIRRYNNPITKQRLQRVWCIIYCNIIVYPIPQIRVGYTVHNIIIYLSIPVYSKFCGQSRTM